MNMDKETQYIKRTQKDYTTAFKLAVVKEVESGELGIKAAARKYGIQAHSTVTTWLRKYGTYDHENRINQSMAKNKDQRIKELEAELALVKKQKARLENQLETSDKKVILMDMMIEIAQEEFGISVRKKFLSEQLSDLQKSKHKQSKLHVNYSESLDKNTIAIKQEPNV